jgi:hypothetical protein
VIIQDGCFSEDIIIASYVYSRNFLFKWMVCEMSWNDVLRFILGHDAVLCIVHYWFMLVSSLVCFSNMKMKVTYSSETSVDRQLNTQCYTTEHRSLHNYSCENLKPYTFKILLFYRKRKNSWNKSIYICKRHKEDAALQVWIKFICGNSFIKMCQRDRNR